MIKFRYFIIITSIFSILLGLIYKSNIAVAWSYLGFDYEFNQFKLILGICIYIPLFYLIYNIYKRNNFTFIICLLFFWFSTIPQIIFYCFNENSTLIPIIGNIFYYVFNLIFASKYIRFNDQKEQININFNILTNILVIVGFVIFLSTKILSSTINSISLLNNQILFNLVFFRQS